MKEPNKMKCSRVQEDAIALLGVELTDDEEQKVFAHLSGCPHCREEFRGDRKAWQAISTCPVVTADPSFGRMLSLRLSLDEPSEAKPDQVDRVLPTLDSAELAQDARFDLSRLVSVFASAMPQ
jgi:anti-sigma factor RsiW